MKKADQLRVISEENKTPIEKIIENLEQSARIGYRSMPHINHSFSPEDIQYILSEGFIISQHRGQLGETVTVISW